MTDALPWGMFFAVPLPEFTLLNSNVQNDVLLRHIRALLKTTETIDLVQDGEPLDLHLRPTDSARKSIDPRAVCFVASVANNRHSILFDTVPDSFRPLLARKARRGTRKTLDPDDKEASDFISQARLP